MASTNAETGFVRVADVDEVVEGEPVVVQAGGRSIGLFAHEGAVYATDNRCPHMGFPLTEGSVEEGVLTCPWHHARFELSCGDTFDPFADDVRTYPVEVRDDGVYVDPDPPPAEPPTEHYVGRLEHGLREVIDLVIAKAVIGLDDEGVDPAVPVRIGTEFGVHYRESGWGTGLTTLGAMTNLLGWLEPADRRQALYVGLTAVADDCAGEAPFFAQEPLGATDIPAERLTEWFRDNVEVRDADGAERVLRAAVTAGHDEATVAGMLVAAATDHRYLDSGHRLDFVNKAFETLDRIGWDRADAVLPSLVPGLAAASRAGERASWRQPIDVAGLVEVAAADLPDLVEAGAGREWTEPDGLVGTLLGDDPHAIVDALTTAIGAGASTADLAGVVTYAAARRIAQFGTSNEFSDWNTVHHTYSFSNAVHRLSLRTDVPALYRGVFDAAIKVYLDRFLNTPPVPLPEPAGGGDPDGLLGAVLETFETEGSKEVNRAGRLAAEYLASGGPADRLAAALGGALLREDVGFHPRQNLEAALTQHAGLDDADRARVHLVATARYLSAHTPTRRAGEQTFVTADRLHRGERIHEA